MRTNRLILRNWRPEDLAPFAQMTKDHQVMEFFPATLNKEESDHLAQQFKELIDKHQYGFWAVELIEKGQFIGFIGLNNITFPEIALEIGWRIAFPHWGKGYATEGAKAALDFAFNTLQAKEVVADAIPSNVRSRAVMKKLGMKHNPADDYDKPNRAPNLTRHVLYRITKSDWEAKNKSLLN